MFNWFGPKKSEEVRGAPLGEPMVHYVHERKRLPDEGAQSYAFETLQLAVHSPIDGAVRVRYNNGGSSIGVAFPQREGQVWLTPTSVVDGIPSMAGGIYGSRQFTPDGAMGDLGSIQTVNPQLLRWNNAGDRASNPADVNNPFPFNGSIL